MADLYYFEQAKFDGTFVPCTSTVKPTSKRIEGGRRNIRGVKTVNPGHHHLTLTQLQNNYGEGGKFTRGQGKLS